MLPNDNKKQQGPEIFTHEFPTMIYALSCSVRCGRREVGMKGGGE